MDVETNTEPTESAEAAVPTLDFTFGVENLGPVNKGEVRLRPLTVFIGPNNSGKSYTALAMHCWLAGYEAIQVALEVAGPHMLQWVAGDLRIGDGLLADAAARAIPLPAGWMRACESLGTPGASAEAPPLDESLEEVALRLHARLPETWRNYYQADPAQAVRWGCPHFALTGRTPLQRSLVLGSGEAITVGRTEWEPLKGRIVASDGRAADAVLSHADGSPWCFEAPIGLAPQGVVRAELAAVQVLVQAALFGLPHASRYVPAGRAGLIQARDSVFASLLRASTVSTAKPRAMPGAAAEFLAALGERRGYHPVVRDALSALEQDALRGSVKHGAGGGNGADAGAVYSASGGDVPLALASSSVAELGSALLYIKNHVTPGDLVIIEEPEAHMHPANQRLLARFFARLVRAGVFVLITTHSDYLVEQLGNLVMAGALDREDRGRVLGEQADAYLAPDDLGVYLFTDPVRNGEFVGADIQELEVTPEDGVPPDEFSRVTEEMYDETVRLRRRLRAEE